MRKIIFLKESTESIIYADIKDLPKFKKHANEILGSYGKMTDSEIRKTVKEIYLGGKHVGYIGFSEYSDGDKKCLGIGNFMIFDRGQGIGTKIIEDIVSKNKKEYDLIYCYVEKDNDGAIRFYKRLGKVYRDLNSKNEHLVTFWDNGRYKFE